MPVQRKKGGGVFGGAKFKDTNQKREPGSFIHLTPNAKAAKLGTKTSSSGFAGGGAIDKSGIARDPAVADDKGLKKGGAARKDGGAISGGASAPSLAKRARGGRTSSPFSSAHMPNAREGSSASGHEGE